jgi:hypothetical protein
MRLAALLLVGCSSTQNGSDAGLDAALDVAQQDVVVKDAAMDAMDSSSADAGCSALDLTGIPLVNPMMHDAQAPMPMGGMLLDGKYKMTAIDVYGTMMVPSGQEVDMFSNGKFEDVSLANSEAQTESGTFSTMTTNLNINVTCPQSDTATFGYTATTTSYQRFQTIQSTTLISTFTKF